MERAAYDHIFDVEQVLWWYRGRRAVCEAVLQKWVGAGQRAVLDVGCGTGFNMGWLSDYGKVTGIDMSPDALEYCRIRGRQQVMQGRAETLPIADQTFDMLTAFDLIEHLDDDVAGLREFNRVLRPGGYLMLTVPALPFLYSEHDRRVHHRRRYWKPEVLERVQQAGYSIVHCSYVNFLILPLQATISLMLRLWPRRPHVEFWIPVYPFNDIFTWLSKLEVPIILKWGLPIGGNIVLLARKP